MANLISEIAEKIRSLSQEDRTELMRQLIADLDGLPDTDVAQAWATEAERRHQEIIDGESNLFQRSACLKTFDPALNDETRVPSRSGTGTH